jgi:prepilin-type processing-associated H-X9-DG protein
MYEALGWHRPEASRGNGRLLARRAPVNVSFVDGHTDASFDGLNAMSMLLLFSNPFKKLFA